MTQVHITRYADCPFSAAMELAEKVVGARKDLYVTPTVPLAERVHFAAASTNDRSDECRKHDALLVAWSPENRRMFPDFRGVLTVRPEHRGVWIRMTGEYAPPFGTAGKLFDLMFGRALARKTMHHFLDDVATGVEAAYRDERQHTTTA